MNEALIKGILCGLVAQVISFLQLQGQIKWVWLREHIWFSLLLGIPISYLFMASVRHFVSAFNGEIWPSRIIGFGMGTVIFTVMSYILFQEAMTIKTSICLFLGMAIVFIQMYWR